jgi:hypothetical protein
MQPTALQTVSDKGNKAELRLGDNNMGMILDKPNHLVKGNVEVLDLRGD